VEHFSGVFKIKKSYLPITRFRVICTPWYIINHPSDIRIGCGITYFWHPPPAFPGIQKPSCSPVISYQEKGYPDIAFEPPDTGLCHCPHPVKFTENKASLFQARWPYSVKITETSKARAVKGPESEKAACYSPFSKLTYVSYARSSMPYISSG
jgi:hypothetical protein